MGASISVSLSFSFVFCFYFLWVLGQEDNRGYMSCFNEWIGVVIFSSTSVGVGMLQGLRIFFMHHHGW